MLLIYWYINSVQSRTDNDPGRHIIKKALTFGKVSRDCYISSSANRLKDKKAPVVIFLHGMDGAWPSRKFTKPQYDFINSIAWKYDFIAAFPKGTEGTCVDPAQDKKGEFMFYTCWNFKNESDLKFLKFLKDALVNQYGANPERFFLVGFSNGGYFVSDYMIKNNKREFQGYGIISAGGNINLNDSINSVKEKFPISLDVGKNDPYQLDDMRQLKKQLQDLGWQEGKNLNYQEYYARHEMSRNDFEQQIKFFLKKD